MEVAERSTLATVAYYSALRWPLTVEEIARRCISPSRLGGAGPGPSIDEVLAITERLAAAGMLRASDGLYLVGERPADLREHRVRRGMITAAKWRRMLRAARWLRVVPYVRMMAGAGSLALGSCSDSSDWDLFVVVQARRLYTARAGLLLVAWFMGRLRTKDMREASDRFCFNHFVTTDGLAIRHRGLFMGHALAWLVPFYDPSGVAEKLRHANAWTADVIARPSDSSFAWRQLAPSRILGTVRRTLEAVLDTFVGRLIERALRRWMQGRIEREPATHEKGGRVVADDRELEFHPHSFEAVALARYNATLSRLGLGQYAEHDSGLNR